MLQRGLGHSWTIGGRRESGPSVNVDWELMFAGGQHDSSHVGVCVQHLDGQR